MSLSIFGQAFCGSVHVLFGCYGVALVGYENSPTAVSIAGDWSANATLYMATVIVALRKSFDIVNIWSVYSVVFSFIFLRLVTYRTVAHPLNELNHRAAWNTVTFCVK